MSGKLAQSGEMFENVEICENILMNGDRCSGQARVYVTLKTEIACD